MKQHHHFFVVLFLLAVFSCSESTITKPDNFHHDYPQTKSTSPALYYEPQSIVLGEKLTNPYSVKIMQDAAITLTKPGQPVLQLAPTNLYVRFLPKDSADLNILYNIEKLELFDYPLDYEILVEGDYYHDPSLPENSHTWLYTTVKPDYKFPDVQYEILEECYIPETEISIATFSNSNDSFSPEDLEREAFRLAGLDSMWTDEPLTRAAAAYPSGRFTVIDTKTGLHEPIKGVKIRVHNIIKWATTYTDEDGYYYIEKKYRTNVHYAMIFQNSKGFKIWGNWAMLAPANHNMRFNTNTGISQDFSSSSNAWDWATVNNAVYDYYEKCHQERIMPPPSDLTIWCLRNTDWSSAIMVPHIKNVNVSMEILNNFFLNIGISGSFLGLFLPDVFISTKFRESDKIYATVMHELSHVSHCMWVGGDYWNRYINYILNCWSHGQDTYGDGTLADNGLCAVGEMWGYAMGYIYQYEKYRGAVSKYDAYPRDDDYFFYPDILWDIYKNGWLTKGDIFGCLNKNTDNVAEFRENMKKQFHEYAIKLDLTFAEYGIYDRLGEWIIRNVSQDTICVSMNKFGLPNMLKSSQRLTPDASSSSITTFGLPLIPGEEFTIAKLPYNAERKYDFYDIVNIDEISPSSIYLADKHGHIFQRAVLDASVPLFQGTGYWIEESESNNHKWIYNCNASGLIVGTHRD